MSPSDRKTSCIIKMADLEKKEKKTNESTSITNCTKNYMMPRRGTPCCFRATTVRTFAAFCRPTQLALSE